MKGYFASLAKQSGLHVSGQKPGALVSPAEGQDRISKPLHREETILVPPSVDDARIENAAAPRSPQKMDIPKGRGGGPSVETQPVMLREKAKKVLREEESDSKKGPAKVEAASPEVRLLHDIGDIAGPRTAIEDRISHDVDRVPEITVVEQQKFIEQEEASEISADIPAKPEPSQIVNPETVEQPRFFVKTAEIIERGEPGSAEINSILIEEVRQWVASGPAEPEAPAVLHQRPESLTVRDVPRRETGPGTVVIKERVDHESPGEPAAIEEQNFNLSIGTISVIIEEPEKPAEPLRVVQNERSQDTSSGVKREFSRLSRNYL